MRPVSQPTEPLTISEPRIERTGATEIVSSSISTPLARHEVWYRCASGPATATADPFLVASLVPAMRLGRPIQVQGTVSRSLLEAIPQIQQIFHAWYPALHRVPVHAPAAGPVGPAGSGVACFFSGGVDSFYTLLTHREEVSHLVLVHGFDLKLDKVGFRDHVSGTLHGIAQELGKPLVEVETNLRAFSNHYTRWAPEYFGAALASVALLLGAQFQKVFIPASVTYAELYPWGSHPLVDPLWSTESTRIVHDGCEATRIEKVALIAASDIVRRSLRVCWENRHDRYNCGQCEKCLRTMVSLRVVGALDKVRTFPGKLNLLSVATVDVPNPILRSFYEQNLRVVLSTGRDRALARSLRITLNPVRHHLWHLARGGRNRARRFLVRVASLVHHRARRLERTPPHPGTPG